MPFLNNAWYMAAWGEEIGERLFARRLFGQPVVLYRLHNGSVAALVDRCPHRFAPLSRGERQDDDIRCGYHGLTFNAAGACVRNPFGERIPQGAMVRAFPCTERDGIVWLWAGDPTLADTDVIPRFDVLTSVAGTPPLHGYMKMQANYEFGTDNLMDLSHIEFVHKGSFAGAGVIFAGKHEVLEEGRALRSNWWMPGVAAPAHTFGIYPRDLLTDHWLDMHWEPPAAMRLEIGATPRGEPRKDGIIVQQAHILTPETETTSHYFWATTRTLETATAEGDAMLRTLMTQAFDTEDKPMIESAFQNLEGADFWEQKPVFLGVDAGGARARRIIQRLLAREASEMRKHNATRETCYSAPIT